MNTYATINDQFVNFNENQSSEQTECSISKNLEEMTPEELTTFLKNQASPTEWA